MSMKLLMIEELGDTEKILGIVDKYEIQQLINAAERHSLKCLSFVDTVGNTYFNEMQIAEIKNKELAVLENDPTVNKKLLAMIKEGADIISQTEHLYLKFEDFGN